MKRVVLIANRLNVLECLLELVDIKIVKLYVLEDSLLDKSLSMLNIVKSFDISTFTMKDKGWLMSELKSLDFDILLSNGCPFILPIKELRKDNQLFINIHPTLLPDLKGKTPLNGVFMTHRKRIGATMHYIDDGIDTGRIISQKGIKLTSDIDQGLVYRISFNLEREAFSEGWKLLQEADFNFPGKKQRGEGSYFNRTDDEQTINTNLDDTDRILDKVKSFNIRGQGTLLIMPEGSYRVYAAEKIINPYLLETYKETMPMKIAFKYDNKIVFKTRDGMIKLTDYEMIK